MGLGRSCKVWSLMGQPLSSNLRILVQLLGGELDVEKRILEAQRPEIGPGEWSGQTLLLVRRLLMEGQALNSEETDKFPTPSSWLVRSGPWSPMAETQNLRYGAGPKEWRLKQGKGQLLQSMDLGLWSEAAKAWMLRGFGIGGEKEVQGLERGLAPHSASPSWGRESKWSFLCSWARR